MSESLSLDRQQRQKLEAISPSHDTRDLTIVFTDLVGFTALRTKVGEQRGLEILGVHQTIVRRLLAGYPDAREIKTMGDAFLLAFARPSDAVAFSLRLLAAQRVARAADMPDLPGLRIGIHSGEVAVYEGTDGIEQADIFGLQVDITKRVQDLAADDQILMTCFVFDNARTRVRAQDLEGIGEIRWERHGFYRLKGLDHPIEICEVGEIEHAPFTAPAGAAPVDRVESDDIDGWRPGLGVGVPATNWRLESRLGVGGFGEVWLAHDRTRAARRTVFKFCTRRSKVKSLQRELHVFNTLTGESGRTPPGIVEVRGTHDTEAPYYIELEFLTGGDLRRWIETHGQRASLRTKLSLANQMAHALALVHRNGFVHRDIKPSNFLLEVTEDPARAPTLKISDFGIGQVVIEDLIDEARATMALHSATLSQAAGTYLYIAPELIRPSSTEPSSGEVRAQIQKRAQPSADVYGLGVTLYQLFAGSIDAIPGPGLRAVDDPVLREDITACLDEDPNQRPTAEELTDRLTRYDERLKAAIEKERSRLEQERQQAVALAAALEAKRKAGRRTLIAVSAALLVAIILGTVSMTQRRAAVSARDEALKATARAETARNEALMATARAESARNEALTATARAESARNDAEALVDFMLTDLREKLEPIGRLDLLGDVAERSVEHYEHLGQTGESSESPLQRAVALRVLGDVLEEKGNVGGARDAFEEALAIARDQDKLRPENLEAQGEIARLLNKLGAILRAQSDRDGALQRHREAMAILEDLRRRDPENLEWTAEMATSKSKIGDAYMRKTELVSAYKNFEEAHDLREALVKIEPQSSRWRRSFSDSKLDLSGILRLWRRHDEAVEMAAAAVEIREQLCEEEPADLQRQRDLAVAIYYLGRAEESQGSLEQALEHFRKTVTLRRRFVEHDPKNALWLSDLGYALNRIGDTCEAMKRNKEAADVRREALTILQRLVDLDPENAEWLYYLAFANYRLSRSLYTLGESKEALVLLRESTNSLRQVVALEPKNRLYLLNLAVFTAELGGQLNAMGRREEAIDALRECAATRKSIFEILPEEQGRIIAMVVAYKDLALALDELERHEEAVDVLSECAAIIKDSVGGKPENASALHELSWTLVMLGRTQQGLGDDEGAHESWEWAVKSIEPVTQAADPATINVKILDTRAQALLHLGRVEEARPMVDMLLERGWNNSEFLALCREHGLLPASASPGDVTQ